MLEDQDTRTQRWWRCMPDYRLECNSDVGRLVVQCLLSSSFLLLVFIFLFCGRSWNSVTDRDAVCALRVVSCEYDTSD